MVITAERTPTGLTVRANGCEDTRLQTDLMWAGATWHVEERCWTVGEDRLQAVLAVAKWWHWHLSRGLLWGPQTRQWRARLQAERIVHLTASYLNATNGEACAGPMRVTENVAEEPPSRYNPDGPQTLAEYDVGQGQTIRAVQLAIQAAKLRGGTIDHVLLDGPPGLGKTTLANIIARELGTHIVQTSGPALQDATNETLIGVLTKLSEGDVLFIDEVHRLGAGTLEEALYPAMEVFQVHRTRAGEDAEAETIDLPRFTLVGATTRPGLLSAALRSRFGIRCHLDFYSPEQLERIASAYADRLRLTCEPEGLAEIARRSRGTARIVKTLLRRVSDFALVKGDGRITQNASAEALAELGIDDVGLDAQDRQYMQVLVDVYRGGPAGVRALAATLNVETDTLEDVVEPYLLKLGFVVRRPRGRQITHLGRAHLGLPVETVGGLGL